MFEHSITRVKVYEIIKENLYDKSVPKSIWKGLGFEPKMVGEFASNIMNNKIFLSIVIKVPNVFRCNNWELIYGNNNNYIYIYNNSYYNYNYNYFLKR